MNVQPRTQPSREPIAFSPQRIFAMVLRYWYLLRSSWPRLLELIYWPAVQMMMWGFLQLYVSENSGFFAKAGGTFIGAVLLWDILFRGQLGFSISFLEEMWARNMGNLMMSPLRPGEFIARFDDHEHRAACDRHGAGDNSRDGLFRIQSLRVRLCAGGVLHEPDPHQLGGRDFRVRHRAPQWHGRGEHGLDHHVPAVAAHLRLLPGRRCCRAGFRLWPGCCRRPMCSKACGRC